MALWVWLDHLWGILSLLLIPRVPLLVHTHCLLCDSLGGNPGSLELSLLLGSICRCQKRPKSSHCSPATHGECVEPFQDRDNGKNSFPCFQLLAPVHSVPDGPIYECARFLPTQPCILSKVTFLFWELKTPSTSRKCDWWELNRPQYSWVLPFCLPSHPRLCKLQAWCWEAWVETVRIQNQDEVVGAGLLTNSPTPNLITRFFVLRESFTSTKLRVLVNLLCTKPAVIRCQNNTKNVAWMGERLTGKEKVLGSIPSTGEVEAGSRSSKVITLDCIWSLRLVCLTNKTKKHTNNRKKNPNRIFSRCSQCSFVGTQGLVNVRQSLYHWAMPPTGTTHL